MQEALRQGCRRSARLIQRSSASATAAAAAGLAPARAVHHHHDTENAGAAASADTGSRRRRRAITSKQAAQQDTKDQSQQEQRQGTAQLEALGSITNRPDVLEAVAAADSLPPPKKPRGRPPRAAAAAATRVVQAAAADSDNDTAGPSVPDTAAGRKARQPASSKASGMSSSKAATGGRPSRAAEQRLWAQGFQAVAGVDEAGRGPLAGPVLAAAAVLPADAEFELLNDSKQMTEAEREAVYEQLTSHPGVSYAVALVTADDIDKINILQATMLAMRAAVEGLVAAGRKADYLLVDGNRKPGGDDDGTPQQTVVKGDASVTCIAAASVLAKVSRDRLMVELDRQYPQYGFAQHKGYGTAAHRAAIQQHGPCPAHRRSFEPIKSMMAWAGYPGGSPQATIIAKKAAGTA